MFMDLWGILTETWKLFKKANENTRNEKYLEVPHQTYQQNEHRRGKSEPTERSIKIIQTKTKGEKSGGSSRATKR